MPPSLSASLLDVIHAALESSVDAYEAWLALWTALVALGLLYEYLYDWEVFKELHSPLGKLIGWLPILGAVMVTVGVAGELYVEVMASAPQGQLRALNNGIAGVLNREASEARKRAMEAQASLAGALATAESAKAMTRGFESKIADSDARAKAAEAQVASANATAAEAQSMAKGAELARAELEARIAPRTLDLAHRVSIGNALRVFAPSLGSRQVRFEWQGIDIEATIFGVELKDALSRAGIQSDGPTAGLRVGGPITIGLTITGPTKDAPFIGALYSLLHADLPRENMSAAANPTFDTSPVTITIGFKTPQGLDTLPQQ